jgi:hypothetical protein
VKPPSFRRKLSRTIGRRSSRKAQLALIADASRPLVMAIARFTGTIVETAAKRKFKICESLGKMISAKSLERWSAQQSGPENSASHFGNLAPIHTCRDCRANYAPHTGAGHGPPV